MLPDDRASCLLRCSVHRSWKSSWCFATVNARDRELKQSENEVDNSWLLSENVCEQAEEVPETDAPSFAAAFSNIDPDLVGALC